MSQLGRFSTRLICSDVRAGKDFLKGSEDRNRFRRSKFCVSVWKNATKSRFDLIYAMVRPSSTPSNPMC
jgi:hypothetical protein